MPDSIPTSDLQAFKDQLLNPNTEIENAGGQERKIMKVQKNFVLSLVSDSTGCGHIRNVFPLTYMNSQFGKTGKFNLIMTPVAILQKDILTRTRSIFFQRNMSPAHVSLVRHYKEMQKTLKFKMVYDIDDFIWEGPDEGERIPEYNFGHRGITEEVRKANVEIMNMMDVVCVSTEFLKQYLKNNLKIQPDVVVVPNAVPQFFWGPDKKVGIRKRLERPKVIYTGSPTHYNNETRLLGDWQNAWLEWVVRNVRQNKIDFTCMGGLPFFFEEIKEKIKIIPWVNSYQYHLPIKVAKPDFGIAPLVPNYFNYSKSHIKYQEYCALGIVGLGTVFTNGKPSPYDVCQVKVPDNVTSQQIDQIFWPLCEPEKYNSILQTQYQQMEAGGWWLESPQYIKLLMSIF